MSTEKSRDERLSRRAMLSRLGLAATAVYTAPVLLKLGEARASGVSGHSAHSRPSGASGWSGSSRGSFSGNRKRRSDRRRKGGRSSFS